MDIIEELEDRLGEKCMTMIARQLQSVYSVSKNDFQLWCIIEEIFRDLLETPFVHTLRLRTLANEFVNSMIMRYFPGENVIKYHFVKRMIHRRNEVLFFEMTTPSNRLDICRINANSFAYEIKTELDGLERLRPQVDESSEYTYNKTRA